MQTAFAGTHLRYRAWLAAIKRTHMRNVTVRVLDLEHNHLGTFGGRMILDGNVTGDVTRDVIRMLELNLFDPSLSIAWEPDTDTALPLHMRRMLQVWDARFVRGEGWIPCPLFTGPVSDFDRDGATVMITAEGKDRLLRANFGVNRTWAKKTKVVTIMREILHMAGETDGRIHLPDLAATIPERLSVVRTDTFLDVLKKLAQSVDRVIFYDGRGHFQMRRMATSAGFTVDRTSLLGPAKLNRTMPELKNRWIVLGPKPKGSKKRVSADLALPSKHAFSAQKLGRNGQPRWLIHQEETSAKTAAKAAAIAGRKRDEQQRFTNEVTFECLPFPHLEEHDLIRCVDPATGTRHVRLRTWTLPLVSGGMSVGFLKRSTVVKPRTKRPQPKKTGHRGGRR